MDTGAAQTLAICLHCGGTNHPQDGHQEAPGGCRALWTQTCGHPAAAHLAHRSPLGGTAGESSP